MCPSARPRARRRRGRVARVGPVSTVSYRLISTTFTVIALHYRRPLVVVTLAPGLAASSAARTPGHATTFVARRLLG